MKPSGKLLLTITGVFFFGIHAANAQDETADQADVWATVEGQWDAASSDDKKWTDRLLVDKFSGWGNESPAPRSKASTKMWDRFSSELGRVVAHELYPLAIVVHKDMAVAHYLYSSAYKSKDGDFEMNKGRYTDILVRTDEGWKFIAWHGGDDE